MSVAISSLDVLLNNQWTKKIILKRNEFLKIAGSKDQNIYFIESGCIRIYITNEKEEHDIRFGYKGSLITALDSFINGKPSPLVIQALKKTQVKVLNKNKFMNIIHSDEKYLKLWQAILENLIEQQLEREMDLLTYSPEERYRRVQKRSPQLFQEVPLKYIASYLRMSPETLSRIKKH